MFHWSICRDSRECRWLFSMSRQRREKRQLSGEREELELTQPIYDVDLDSETQDIRIIRRQNAFVPDQLLVQFRSFLVKEIGYRHPTAIQSPNAVCVGQLAGDADTALKTYLDHGTLSAAHRAFAFVKALLRIIDSSVGMKDCAYLQNWCRREHDALEQCCRSGEKRLYVLLFSH